MPRTLRIAQLCDTLAYISQNFDVGVSQGDVLLYDLNLEKCAEYLGVLRTMGAAGVFVSVIHQRARADGRWVADLHSRHRSTPRSHR